MAMTTSPSFSAARAIERPKPDVQPVMNQTLLVAMLFRVGLEMKGWKRERGEGGEKLERKVDIGKALRRVVVSRKRMVRLLACLLVYSSLIHK